MICKKCVMPERKPHIYLNEDGICNLCVAHQNTDVRSPLETDFLKILRKYKGKKKRAYDCLVMCSGGKDSISSLYYMKKRYKLNPLAFTFDHGFEPADAMENVKSAVEILGVDFMFFKSSFMKEMFKKVLDTESKASICHLCSIWYMQLTYDIAARFDIPIIVAGWTKGQSNKEPVGTKCISNPKSPEFIEIGAETNEFLDKYVRTDPKYKDFPSTVEEVTKKAHKRHRSIVVSPHWFLPYDQNDYVDLIKKELNWKQPKESYPKGSTNCTLNFVSSYNSMKHFGFTHYHVEMSKLIREGVITREQALEDLKINYDVEYLNSIVEPLLYKFDKE